MALNITELEQIIERLNDGTADEVREMKLVLKNWFESGEAISIVFEILQNPSRNQKIILTVLEILISYIWSKNDLKKEFFSNICDICLNQIESASENTSPTDSILRKYIKLASISTYYSRDIEIFRKFSILTPNILLFYLSDVLNIEEKDQLIGYEERLFSTESEIFTSTLFQAQVCDH